MNILSELQKRAAQKNKTIVLPESSDPRVIDAAKRILIHSACRLILVGNPDTFPDNGLKTDSSGRITIRSWETETNRSDFMKLLKARLKKKNPGEEEILGMLEDPLIYAGVLVALNEADAAVAGSLATTASVIRAGIYTIGVNPGSDLVSSIFLMVLKDGRTVTFSDCGVVPYPDSSQLASIAVDAGNTHKALTGEDPRIALLSFSTAGSSSHERVDLVREATNIAAAKKSEWKIDGELQFDAAFLPSVALKKAPASSLKGNANVFIFPNLDAGNIAYKITERLAGAAAIGPILQGLNKPYLDLSRGCSVEDIVSAVHVAAVLSDNR